MTNELDGDDVDMASVLEALLDAREEELSVACAGRVERYYADAQTVDVTPVVRRTVPRADGSPSREALPTLRSVRLMQLRLGPWFLHMPVAAGDTVLLVCLDRDHARWIVTGAQSDAVDTRTHHIAHAVAIPGLYPRPAALAAQPSDAMVLGHVDGPKIEIRSDGQVHVAGDEQLARFAQLEAHLDAIATGMDALMNLLSPGTPQPNYGVAAKAALDASQPIPTTNTRGS